MPQRQGNAGNAAVAEGGQKVNAAQKACRGGAAKKAVPQRQRIVGNAAVAEGGQKVNAAQKACRGGAAKKAVPQRQGNAGNAAVVEVRRWDCGEGMQATDCRELLRNLRKLLKNLGVMKILITFAVNRYRKI